MSEPSKRIPSSTYDDTAARKAVEQLIARRARAQQWPRRRIEELLETLGLREYPEGGRTDQLGGRIPLTATQLRERTEQEQTS